VPAAGAGSGVGKFDPDGRVIAGPFAAAHLAVDTGGDKAAGNRRAQQEMIDAQSGVAGERIPEIFPEGVDPLARVQRPQRIGPALLRKAAIGDAHLRPKQGVIDPALRRIDIQFRRHHIKVTGQDYRRAVTQQALGMSVSRSNHRSL
jgi:hypothetical protein